MKLPSPRTEPASERTSPLKAMSFSSSVPRLAASCRAMRPVRLSRSIASEPRLTVPVDAGQSIRPFAIEAEIERHAVDRQFGGAHLAAHQRAQAEFDVELVGANLAEIVGAADHDRAQLQRRRRQQPRVELAADADDAYTVVASKGGSDEPPAWYVNLSEEPEVEVQVWGDVFKARARTANAEEKPEMWRTMVAEWPDYDAYQRNTDREIPVVVLERT